jgi:hypothetical protein
MRHLLRIYAQLSTPSTDYCQSEWRFCDQHFFTPERRMAAPTATSVEGNSTPDVDAQVRVARALAPAGAFADLDPSSACIVEFQVLMNVYETLTVSQFFILIHLNRK